VIALAVFLAAQGTAAAPVAEPTAEDIVVLAQKLKATRIVWKASDKSGAWKLSTCKVKKSIGDKAVDAIACRALEQCLPTMPLGAKQAPPTFHQCVFEQRDGMIAELARQRSQAEDGVR
jgi:hypothetical protein